MSASATMFTFLLLTLAAIVVVNAQNTVNVNSMEITTCCSIQTACRNCTNVYRVNGITYCCPNCQGEALVTALVCTCTLSVADPSFAPNCTVSNKIVGDYIYEKPSTYSAKADRLSTVSAAYLFAAGFLTVLVTHRLR